ncbi:hypothetical protein [Actinoalloteichus hymeniacidonis]|uniref:Uncharacterized protein n=1 Tax=Actinoalloteichus hymeniacidonis TaxID=340345 RepID=A0AAC9N030_9PSEU|nr:hypothetical protein [Actinoalloteichus hymeniacidonis]AOS66073.1 hypothetical protein TL08_26520 [Actinoalloteichus hymeniacidonis]MBB5905823.1 hypothetical protein [Actinoalloteichus hymeniacidonis]
MTTSTSTSTPCVATVLAHTHTGQPETLVLIAEQHSRAITLAVKGRGLATLTARSAERVHQVLTTDRPSAALELPVLGRGRQTATLRITVHGIGVHLGLLTGRTLTHRWRIHSRPAFTTATARAIAYLATDHT